MSADTWSTIVTSIANMGFSALVAWYLLYKAMPKMIEDFTRALKEEREDANRRVDIERQRADQRFHEDRERTDALDQQRRIDVKEALQAVVGHCEKEGMRRDEALKYSISTVDLSLKGQIEVLEEVRDGLREVKTALTEVNRTN